MNRSRRGQLLRKPPYGRRHATAIAARIMLTLIVTVLRRILLLLLALALPLQGAMAASRLCMANTHPPVEDSAAEPHGSHGSASRSSEGHHAAAQHAHHAGASLSTPASGDQLPMTGHASGTCKHCAACSLTVTVAPPAPNVDLGSAGFAAFRPIVVPVPHNVADGLERPPRTL